MDMFCWLRQRLQLDPIQLDRLVLHTAIQNHIIYVFDVVAHIFPISHYRWLFFRYIFFTCFFFYELLSFFREKRIDLVLYHRGCFGESNVNFFEFRGHFSICLRLYSSYQITQSYLHFLQRNYLLLTVVFIQSCLPVNLL